MSTDLKSAPIGTKLLRWALMAVSAVGIIVFSVMLASSFSDKAVLEKAAIFAIQSKVQAEVKETYPNIEESGFHEGAKVLRDRFDSQGEAIQQALDAKMDVAVATVMSRLCGCETVTPERQSFVTSIFKDRGLKAQLISQKLETFIKGKYDSTVQGLIRDIRISSGVNMCAFALIFLLALIKPTARFHLLLPASLLAISSILTIALYVFGQNWFYTIMLGNFWGFTYLIFMAVIFALVADITLLGGTITSVLLSPFAVLTPC